MEEKASLTLLKRVCSVPVGKASVSGRSTTLSLVERLVIV